MAAPMGEKRQIFLARPRLGARALMFEPRGHDVMSGSILYPPTRADCDVGVLFIEICGCLPMCGHGTIGTVTVALEHGLVVPRRKGRLVLEAPAGRVEVELRAEWPLRRERAACSTSPSYSRSGYDVEVDVPGLGSRSSRRLLWRQLLRNRRAAERTAAALDSDDPPSEILRLESDACADAVEKIAAPVHPDEPGASAASAM